MKFRNAEKTQSKAARQVFFDGMLEDSAFNRRFIIIRMQFSVFVKLDLRYIINSRHNTICFKITLKTKGQCEVKYCASCSVPRFQSQCPGLAQDFREIMDEVASVAVSGDGDRRCVFRFNKILFNINLETV